MSKSKIILGILIIIWMGTVFFFSNQPSIKSSNTSKGVIEKITNRIPNMNNATNAEKEGLIEELQTPVRKLAHFSLYTVGGILILLYLNQFNLTEKRKIIYSFIIGVVYATTDEIHQLFVIGRSCELRDVCIDSLGIVFGIGIAICIIKLIRRKSSEKGFN